MKALITILVVLLLAAGVYIYFTNDTVRNTITKALKSEPEQIASIQTKYNAVFVIFDPSGSTNSTYSVPRISVGFISAMIDKLRSLGYGEIWLTYVRKDAYKANVLHFPISKPPQPLVIPVRFGGEAKYKFNKRVEQYRLDSLDYVKKESIYQDSLNASEQKFLSECEAIINNGYGKKKPGEDYSDIIGALNAGTRSLGTVPHDSLHYRFILLISDGCQSLPRGVSPKTLNRIPDDVKIITVNHSGSGKSVVANRSTEVDNLDRSLEMIFKNDK
ncbi:MAG: hypothetical protein ABSD46_02985 [Bacteroidota bacterium]